MASFRLKLVGYGPFGATVGRQYQMNDAAVSRVIDAARRRFDARRLPGQPATLLTDQQIVVKMFDHFMAQWIAGSFANAKDIASKAAQETVSPDTATASDDNA